MQLTDMILLNDVCKPASAGFQPEILWRSIYLSTSLETTDFERTSEKTSAVVVEVSVAVATANEV